MCFGISVEYVFFALITDRNPVTNSHQTVKELTVHHDDKPAGSLSYQDRLGITREEPSHVSERANELSRAHDLINTKHQSLTISMLSTHMNRLFRKKVAALAPGKDLITKKHLFAVKSYDHSPNGESPARGL